MIDFATVHSIAQKNDVRIQGIILPAHWLPGHVKILNASMRWKDQFELVSGTARFSLRSPIYQLSKQAVTFFGENLRVKIYDSNNSVYSGREVTIYQIEGDIEFIPGADPVIKSLRVDSPELKIQIENKS